MEGEISEVVDLVHSLVLQSRSSSASECPGVASGNLNSVLSPPSRDVNVLVTPTRSQTFPVRKKVPIKSAPLKPPDIGNVSLFPSVEESILVETPKKRVSLKSSVGISPSPTQSRSTGDAFSLSPAQDKKLKTLEAKLTEPSISKQSTIESAPSFSSSCRASKNELPSTPSRKTPRSAKLFSELSSERREKLDELVTNYSKSMDANQCRNVLDEMEFLFQLLNTSTVPPPKPPQGKDFPLLCSAAEQAYFVIKVVIYQLDKVFISVPTFVIQLIIENYPHKIPKPVRKHLDDWIIARKGKSVTIDDTIPVDLAKTVTFQSDKDGRSNFPHQTDFHAFCKQRDMFYSIRESWTTSSSSSNGGLITDRSKARMSFPPVTSGSTRFVDSIPFKVQSLFMINRSPTNLFHMASLFVSHYLLEARAQEVGGVPKDDNMKEFFQSNPAKLLQLNSRFSTTAETLESEMSLNLAFQKTFLLSSSPKFVQHVVDRLIMEISEKEATLEKGEVTKSGQVCRFVKDTVHLARLLGFSYFLPYISEDTKNNGINSLDKEAILQEQVTFRSYQSAPLDLKHFVEKASRCGRLTTTCPWIIEYLLQCDSVTLMLPSYQPILATLLFLYRNILNSTSGGEGMSEEIRNFLRFYFGVLFSSKNFPDLAFSLRTQDLLYEPERENVQGLIDLMGETGRNLIDFFFEDNFNRFRRILSWGKLEVSHPSITGEFRHIRPIPASEKSADSSKSTALVSKEKVLQNQLEATFFELYSPSVKRSVDFIAERMTSNFVTIAKTQLFPGIKVILVNQGIFGVRAAEKCRMRIGEEMNKYLMERVTLSVKLFLEQAITPGVLGICQRIAIRKAKESGNEWIRNYINAGMFPDIGAPEVPTSSTLQATSTPPAVKVVPEDPPFEILILIHRTLRKLHRHEKIDPQLVDKVLSCQTLGKCSWTFAPLIDWGLGLITYQPQVLNLVRTKQLISLWKMLWSPTANIMNSRNLLILNHSENPRDSWIKLGSVTQLLISEGLLKPDQLEKQCLSLLREEWPEEVHKRISEFLTIVLESFHEREEWHSESAQVLDWVAWLCSGQPDQD